ncbi:MAG: EVE domain-containing protein [Bacteroidota bacterium]
MSYWLAKTEPETYSYADLVRLGRDRWNGVKNPVALKHLKNMQPGDLVFIYHTGKQKAIIGVAKVVSPPYPDPELNNPRFIVVDLQPEYLLPQPVTLKEIRANPAFEDWVLVHQPRLSVMPVSREHWELVHKLSAATKP